MRQATCPLELRKANFLRHGLFRAHFVRHTPSRKGQQRYLGSPREHQPFRLCLHGRCSAPAKHWGFRSLDRREIWQIFGNVTKRNILQQSATGARVEVNLRAKKAIKPLEASGLIC
jgi:hypothetical protein